MIKILLLILLPPALSFEDKKVSCYACIDGLDFSLINEEAGRNKKFCSFLYKTFFNGIDDEIRSIVFNRTDMPTTYEPVKCPTEFTSTKVHEVDAEKFACLKIDIKGSYKVSRNQKVDLSFSMRTIWAKGKCKSLENYIKSSAELMDLKFSAKCEQCKNQECKSLANSIGISILTIFLMQYILRVK